MRLSIESWNKNMSKTIRIGTRKSVLALVQTELTAEALRKIRPDITIEIVTRDTLGDKILDKPLQEFGGKGVFVSEFEQAILEGIIDLAVHSAKDMPMELAPGLTLAAVSRREDPRDVLVTLKGRPLPDSRHRTSGRYEEIGSAGEILIGTSSPRRRLLAESQAEAGGLWPVGVPVRCESLRGNVHTRLKKLEHGVYDGIILAAAGLKRLGLLDKSPEESLYEFHFFNPEEFIPAGGQGIMAVEGLTGSEAADICAAIDNRESRLCLTLERRILELLGAGCHEPVGVYSRIRQDKVRLWGISSRESQIRRICLEGGLSPDELERLAGEAAEKMRI